MDLRKYYFQNIQKNEYHYQFYNFIQRLENQSNIFGGHHEFEVFDEEEAIKKFKDLCQPEVTFSIAENKCWFYLVTYFLYKSGYEIKEFPRVLARPPLDPYDFTYREIRNKIIENGGDDNGTVTYKVRRLFIAHLTFEIRSEHIFIDDYIDKKFVEISNRQASFNNMSLNEKLAEIANLMESMLKYDGDFITPEYSSICFDFISNDIVKNYRKKMQCFRHASDEALKERNSYTEKQKNFLVDYGITIVKVIYAIMEN